jgi:hypothetical protein
MQANEWGPSAWKFLHTVTFAYPQDPDEEDKINFKVLFDSLRYTLPCSSCRSYFTQIYKYICIDHYLDSREGLTWWLFIVHNLVNRKLNRDLANFEDVVLEYENYRARCGSMNDIKKYTQCKQYTKPFVSTDIESTVLRTYTKYKEISKLQIADFYKSEQIIDPHFTKCSINYKK